MSEEERLQLEQELLMTCSKAQAINKYIDELEENQRLQSLLSRETNRKEIATYDNAQLDKQLDLYKSVLNEVREYIKEKYKEDYSENDNYVPIENLNLKNCSYERSLQVLAMLDKVGDK